MKQKTFLITEILHTESLNEDDLKSLIQDSISSYLEAIGKTFELKVY